MKIAMVFATHLSDKSIDIDLVAVANGPKFYFQRFCWRCWFVDCDTYIIYIYCIYRAQALNWMHCSQHDSSKSFLAIRWNESHANGVPQICGNTFFSRSHHSWTLRANGIGYCCRLDIYLYSSTAHLKFNVNLDCYLISNGFLPFNPCHAI